MDQLPETANGVRVPAFPIGIWQKTGYVSCGGTRHRNTLVFLSLTVRARAKRAGIDVKYARVNMTTCVARASTTTEMPDASGRLVPSTKLDDVALPTVSYQERGPRTACQMDLHMSQFRGTPPYRFDVDPLSICR